MIKRIKKFRAIAWIVGNWQIALAIAGAFVLYSAAVAWKSYNMGYSARSAEYADAAIEAQEEEDEAAGTMAAEEEIDTANIAAGKERSDDAIRDAGDAGKKPSDASNALNCERVRRQGQISRFPACR